MCFRIVDKKPRVLSHYAGTQPRYVQGRPTPELLEVADRRGWIVKSRKKWLGYAGKNGQQITYWLEGKKTGRVAGFKRLMEFIS